MQSVLVRQMQTEAKPSKEETRRELCFKIRKYLFFRLSLYIRVKYSIFTKDYHRLKNNFHATFMNKKKEQKWLLLVFMLALSRKLFIDDQIYILSVLSEVELKLFKLTISQLPMDFVIMMQFLLIFIMPNLFVQH